MNKLLFGKTSCHHRNVHRVGLRDHRALHLAVEPVAVDEGDALRRALHTAWGGGAGGKRQGGTQNKHAAAQERRHRVSLGEWLVKGISAPRRRA